MQLDKEENQAVIQYCYNRIKTVNIKILERENIKVNQFMELLYEHSYNNKLNTGDYNVSNEELQSITILLKNTGIILKGYFEGRTELIGIKGEENLIFKIIKNENG